MKPTRRAFRTWAAAGAAWLAAAGAAIGQDLRIPPEQVVRDALAHSYRLRISDREVQAADARRQQATAQGLPTLDLNASASRYGGLEDIQLGQTMIPSVEERYSASVALSQPLYTGGRVSGQRESARFQRDAARESLRGAQADAMLEALNAYWNWSKAFYAVRSLDAAVKRMESHAQDMHNQHEAGLVTDNDLLATDVLRDQTQLQLQEAQRRVQLARARIAYLTGQELPEAALPLEPAVPAGLAPPAEAGALDIAGTNRAEIAADRLSVKSSEAQTKVNRAGLYPSVYLTARYELGNPNAMFFPPADEWDDDVFGGVALSWNLLDFGLTRAKTREAAARADQARLRLAQTQERVVLEVKESLIDLENAADRVRVAERARKSAEENLRAATDLWQGGLARHSDVLDAHSKLTDAQYDEVSARADVVLAQSAYDYAVGNLGAEGDR